MITREPHWSLTQTTFAKTLQTIVGLLFCYPTTGLSLVEKNITPSEIENQLKFSMFISDAVVIGDKRKYLTCLIMIDQDNVTKFAQDNEVPFTNYTSLCRSDEVRDLIASEISRVNTKFARVETIKKFRLIDQLLDPEDEELTPTMKLKRKVIEDKYGDLINEMY